MIKSCAIQLVWDQLSIRQLLVSQQMRICVLNAESGIRQVQVQPGCASYPGCSNRPHLQMLHVDKSQSVGGEFYLSNVHWKKKNVGPQFNVIWPTCHSETFEDCLPKKMGLVEKNTPFNTTWALESYRNE